MLLSLILVRDLSIDLLGAVEGCQDELWMLCARSSGSGCVIDKVHQMVILCLSHYICTLLHRAAERIRRAPISTIYSTFNLLVGPYPDPNILR